MSDTTGGTSLREQLRVGDTVAWGNGKSGVVRALSDRTITLEKSRLGWQTPGLRVVVRAPAATTATPVFREIPVGHLAPCPLNPRRSFNTEELAGLADSIRNLGVVEPLVVRPGSAPDRFEILAGERRWRAAQDAGLAVVPCVVRSDVLDESAVLHLMLTENGLRASLNPMEQAHALKRLSELGATQKELGATTGCHQSQISRLISLTRLPETVQERIGRGEVSPSHGEQLVRWIGFPAICESLAARVAEIQLPVRALHEPLPCQYHLQNQGLAVEIGWHLGRADYPSGDECRNCPYQASVTLPNSRLVCLRPDHWQELRDAARRAFVAAGAAGEAASATGNLLTDRSPTVFQLQEDVGQAFTLGPLVNGVLAPYETAPRACGGSCPCYREAFSDEGGNPVGVCVDVPCLLAKRDNEVACRMEAQRREGEQRVDEFVETVLYAGIAAQVPEASLGCDLVVWLLAEKLSALQPASDVRMAIWPQAAWGGADGADLPGIPRYINESWDTGAIAEALRERASDVGLAVVVGIVLRLCGYDAVKQQIRWERSTSESTSLPGGLAWLAQRLDVVGSRSTGGADVA